jgi:hypothetical protein
MPALRNRLRAAESVDGCATSLGRTQAAPNVLLDHELEVRLEFGGEVFSIVTFDRGQEAMHESAGALHDDSPFKAKNLAMISPVRSQ